MYTLEDGKLAISLVRARLDELLLKKAMPKMTFPDKFLQKSGVFVTLNTYPDRNLRGCIGYIEPVKKLKDAIIDMAKNAALKDPRFPAVGKKELEKIVVDVSLLTVPKKIKFDSPEELVSKVKIGRDGLIVQLSWARGLLLPQVPIEWGWDVKTFLSHTCMKAGLPSKAWKQPGIKFESFTATVFREKEPRGEVEEEKLVSGGSCSGQ